MPFCAPFVPGMNSNQNTDLQVILCGPKAYNAFTFSAWFLIVLLVFFTWYFTIGEDISTHFMRVILPVILGCLGLVGSPAGLLLFVGMLAYLLKCDHLPRNKKTLWLIAFFMGWGLSAAIYFFAVYRKQVRPR